MTTTMSSDTLQVGLEPISNLRAAAHNVATAPRVALLLSAAMLALDTLPAGRERNAGRSALALASKVASGKPVDAGKIVASIQDEDDEGPLYYGQVAPPGAQAAAWDAVASALGYAACQEYLRLGESLPALVESFDDPKALDLCIDPLMRVPDLDVMALNRAVSYVRANASRADEGWGRPLRVEDLLQNLETEFLTG